MEVCLLFLGFLPLLFAVSLLTSLPYFSQWSPVYEFYNKCELHKTIILSLTSGTDGSSHARLLFHISFLFQKRRMF